MSHLLVFMKDIFLMSVIKRLLYNNQVTLIIKLILHEREEHSRGKFILLKTSWPSHPLPLGETWDERCTWTSVYMFHCLDFLFSPPLIQSLHQTGLMSTYHYILSCFTDIVMFIVILCCFKYLCWCLCCCVLAVCLVYISIFYIFYFFN